jgi:pyruvate ferredoxin oxidoreductase alpha subunit
VKAGLLKLRVFRPVPREELVQAVKGLRALAVLDRADSYAGFGGPLYTEVRSWLFGALDRLPVVNFVYGLGGRDVVVNDIVTVYDYLQKLQRGEAPLHAVQYLGVRE